MKKILIVTDAWHPQVNGVVRVLSALIPLLRERGYDISLVEPSQFYTLPLPFYAEIPLALFPRRRLRRIIRDFNPDNIHIATEGPLGWAARGLCAREDIVFTTWYHSHFELYVSMRFRGLIRPVSALLRRFHSKATRVFVSTTSLKRELEHTGFRNLVVVPLGVDTSLFIRNPSPSVPSFPTPIFAYLSRLAPEKNPEEFLKLELPGTKLVIGDGPSRARLEKKYGGKNVFVGYKQGTELIDWLSRCDVLIFPSRTETFGLVALEALSCGIPVVAHDLMGPRDIITPGKDGYLGDDLGTLALRALKLSRDDCRAKALQYSWGRSVEKFIDELC